MQTSQWRPRPRLLAAVALVLAIGAAGCSGDGDSGRSASDDSASTSEGGEAADGMGAGAEDASGDRSAIEIDDDLAGRFTWRDGDCDFAEPESVSTTCGRLEVPERWDGDDPFDLVELDVGIFSAGPNDAAPMVYLEGGPGGDPLSNIALSFDQLFGALVVGRDVIVVAQRGTGPSEPSLQCNEVIELDLALLDEDLPIDEELARSTEAHTECADRLARAGVDFAGYNSVQSAKDLEALRRALGHDTWDVFGLSYGTRLAQTLMREYPDHIGAVIVDSVLVIDREPQADIPVVAKRAFEQLFAGCAASDACAETYPEFEQRWFAMVDTLDAEPIEFETVDPLTGETYTVLIDGEDLMGLGFQALYSQSAFAALPEMIDQLEATDTSGVATLVGIELANAAFVAVGTYWSVVCHEEAPFETDEERAAGVTGDPRFDSLSPEDESAEFRAAVCDAFAGGAADPIENELVVSDIPTLVLAGSYDPVTPPADGERLLEGFSNATFVELPNTGHGAIVAECAQQIAVAFLDDPAATVDTSCADETPEPAWAPELFGDVTFEPFSYDADLFSATGVVPVGWERGFDGTFSRQDNLLASSVIVQQVIDDEIADLLVNQIGELGEGDPELIDTLRVDARTWSRYEVIIPGSIIDMFVAEGGGVTRLVLLQHPPDLRDAAVEVLVEPMLEALDP